MDTETRFAPTNEAAYICPHCEDHGWVILPFRANGHQSAEGHGDCGCADCLRSGAHRYFFQDQLPGQDPAPWACYTRMDYCHFCAQGARFRDWLHEVHSGSRQGPGPFRALSRSRTQFPPTAEERERIAWGLRWDQEHPAPKPGEFHPLRLRTIPPPPTLSESELAERKARLHAQAAELGATEEDLAAARLTVAVAEMAYPDGLEAGT